MDNLLENLDFTEICRSCMMKKQKMRPLFGSSIDSMLMAVANVKVTEHDGYPAQMCVQCVLQVSRSFAFKQQCEKTDSTLRQYGTVVLSDGLDDDFRPDPENHVIKGESVDTNEKQQKLTLIELDADQSALEYQIKGSDSNGCVFILSATIEDSEVPIQSEQVRAVGIGDEMKFIASLNLNSNVLDCNEISLAEEIERDNYAISEASSPTLVKSEHTDRTSGVAAFPKLTPIVKVHQKKQTPTTEEVAPPPYDRALSSRFECAVCHKKFSDAGKLRRHSRTHLIDKPHVCKVCGMSFAESSNLTKHHRRHTGELRNVVGKPNLCSVCGKRFKWATSLSKHMKHHTKRKLFVCPYQGCSKYYVEQRSLDIHMFSHDGQKPFSCSYCSKGFTQKCNLQKHERVHTGEKPFKCNVCLKSFAQSGYLVIHQRIHSREKPYGCKECGKQFAASNALTVHLRSHSGERPYGCDVCSKRFSRQETLTIHKTRKHLNDRPYACTLCSAKFESTDSLTTHLKRSHNDRYYHMCPNCGKVFTSLHSLKNHQKAHYKENEADEEQSQPLIQFVVDQELVGQTVDLDALQSSSVVNTFVIDSNSMTQ
ncbi:zinc finger protein 184-like [Sabethes cyaneus]|uniref:zinc finger protein 184-like n=1 Tax=Sabethes cyaneus TaxID=53552 RepID=UPI00237E5963|nr:zinc finger protein 184-like [Sabethes cyaneus]